VLSSNVKFEVGCCFVDHTVDQYSGCNVIITTWHL